MKYSILIALIAAISVQGEERMPLSSAGAVDQISQDAIQSAFQVLRRDYIRREDLTYDQLNRAALQGVLQRLDFGAALVRQDAFKDDAAVAGLVNEVLLPRVGYLRPLTVSEKEITALESALRDFSAKEVTHLILDLRSAAQPAELEAAAGMAELFLPRGDVLFKLRRLGGGDAQLMLSHREPVWIKPLIVLIDSESTNVAETLAAVLKQKKRALLIGSETRGATVRYEEVPLDSGWRLRFASAEVLLADDHSVFKRGIVPDFAVKEDLKSKAQIFLGTTTQPVKTHVFEEARERFNEKSLVAGKNPDLDDYISRSAGRVMPYDRPPARDAVLQRAVDLIQTTGFVK